jgi:chemotaxis protein methyltransferase CheR
MTATAAMEPASGLEMRPREFERIRQMAYDFCGVDLKGKQILVSARLGKKIRSMNLPSFTQYCDKVEGDASGALFTEMIDALTTNHTSFFREVRHFEFLRDTILPGLAGKGAINIWSAACSTGEEPYTIAFSVIDALGPEAYSRLSITATDISTRVLEKAQRGLYPVASLGALSTEMRRECLMKGTGKYAGQCMVKPAIKKLIDFQQWNLMHQSSSFGPFEVIFCRNVMIYFDQETQQNVVDNLVSRLAPGGYLLIGHAESLNGIGHALEFICSATYRKPGGLTNRGTRHQGAAKSEAR